MFLCSSTHMYIYSAHVCTSCCMLKSGARSSSVLVDLTSWTLWFAAMPAFLLCDIKAAIDFRQCCSSHDPPTHVVTHPYLAHKANGGSSIGNNNVSTMFHGHWNVWQIIMKLKPTNAFCTSHSPARAVSHCSLSRTQSAEEQWNLLDMTQHKCFIDNLTPAHRSHYTLASAAVALSWH